jgi:WD40 repeat protein
LFDSLSGGSLGVEAKVVGKCQVLACAPDGKTALLGNWGNTAQLWDLSKGEPVGKRLWESSGVISAAAFSKRGSIVATCNDSGTHIDVWDSKTGERRGGALLGSGGAKSLAIHENSHLALAGCLNGEVSFVNFETGLETVSATKHVGAVNAVALSADARRAISGGQDQTARVWDLNGTQVGDAFVHDSEVLCVALSEDGNLALTGTGNGKAWLWDVPTGKLRGEVFRHWERPSSKASIEAVAFVNNARVVTAERYGVVRQWAIRGLESSDADALRDRVALLTGWTSGGDGLRQRLTVDQWRKLVAEQDARSKADRGGGL